MKVFLGIQYREIRWIQERVLQIDMGRSRDKGKMKGMGIDEFKQKNLNKCDRRNVIGVRDYFRKCNECE